MLFVFKIIENDFLAPADQVFPKISMPSFIRSQLSSSQPLGPEGAYGNPFSNLSEKERLVLLKSKLLEEFDSLNKQPSTPVFHGNQDYDAKPEMFPRVFKLERSTKKIPTKDVQ